MEISLSKVLVVGISSRALFVLEDENEIFEKYGLQQYIEYQLEQEEKGVILQPGTAFHVAKALLNLNRGRSERIVEVIVMSRNSPDTGLRIFKSAEHYDLDITRAAFCGGEPLNPYLNAFDVDLFLSKSEPDVQAAVDIGVAAAWIYDPPTDYQPDTEKVRIAFDADGVLFSEESEEIYQREGLGPFYRHERENANKPLQEGPFAKLLKTLSALQQDAGPNGSPVRIAVVTARSMPAHERVIRTLREWGVRVDAGFFMGNVPKDDVLKAFRAHIFFDDKQAHLGLASASVPAAKVPYKTSSPLSSPTS